MKKIGISLLVVFGFALMLAFAFGSEHLSLAWNRYFGPKREGVRREVFRATRSFNQAKEQELLKLRLEYLRAKDADEKQAIASTIRHRFADYNEMVLESEELRRFLKDMKYSTSTLKGD